MVWVQMCHIIISEKGEQENQFHFREICERIFLLKFTQFIEKNFTKFIQKKLRFQSKHF